MKKLQLFFVLCCITISLVLQANDTKKEMVLHACLKEINHFWSVPGNYEVLSAELLSSKLSFDSREALIQKHLELVEFVLSKRSVKNLSITQQLNRAAGLDILRAYWQQGVFPKNTDHTYAIPYFIDKYNTACAVGHIMRESGAGSMAQLVANTVNNAYIEDMPYQKEISDWANKMGFTVEELKWIQPTYGPPLYYNASIVNPDCSESNGAISVEAFPADGEGIIIDTDELYFAWSNGTTGLELSNVPAGQYCITAYWDEALESQLYSQCFSLNNNVTSDYSFSVQNESCGGNLDGEIALQTGSNDITVNWYDFQGNYIASGEVLSGIDGVSLDIIGFGFDYSQFTAEIIDADGCVAYYTNFVFEDIGFEASVVIDQEAACGEANGSASILTSNVGVNEILWSDGVTDSTERNDLAAGFYTVWLVDESSCEETLFFEMTEECPAPLTCEGSLDWLYTDILDNSLGIEVIYVGEFFDPAMGINIIYIDVINVFDAPDMYTDCEGNLLCSQNGISGNTCQEFFIQNLEPIQDIYGENPDLCNDFTIAYEILMEPTCGGANGYVAIYSDDEIVSANWFDGLNAVERDDLPAGSYTVEVINNNGCVLFLEFVLDEECDPSISCEGDLQWVEDIVETDSLIVGIHEYFAPALGSGGYNIVVIEYYPSGGNYYTIYNCFGDIVCINDEDAGGNCENIIMETAELIQTFYQSPDANDCAAWQVSFESYDAACGGGANGGVSISSNFEFTAVWEDGYEGNERFDLTAGLYMVFLTNDSGCEWVLYVDIAEECPPPPICEGDLSWVQSIIEEDNCVCRAEEYFSYELGLSVIFLDSDCNDIDIPDAYFDCEGNWLCSTNGEIADEDWCELSFTENLQYVQNLYSCNPDTTDCNEEWIHDFWNFADHIYCQALVLTDEEGAFFYELGGYIETGDFVYDIYDCTGNYICRLNSDVPEDFICEELYASLIPLFDLYACENNTNLVNANDDFSIDFNGNGVTSVDFLLNDFYPISDMPFEGTNWHQISTTGGIAGISTIVGSEATSMILEGGTATFDSPLLIELPALPYSLEDDNIIEFDLGPLIGNPIVGFPSNGRFYYQVEGNRLYLTEADISDGFTYEFISDPGLDIQILSEPFSGTAFLNSNYTITYAADTDSIYEDFIYYQICTDIAGITTPVCDEAYIVVTGIPPINGCDYIDFCQQTLCTQPITTTEICFEECSSILDFDNIVIEEAVSVFECSMIVQPNGCVSYTPLPGLEGVGFDELFFSITDGNNCLEVAVTMNILDDCSAVEEPCALETSIHSELIGFGGTEDMAQSSWWVSYCFTDPINTNNADIIAYNWTLSNGDSSADPEFCVDIPVREEGVNIPFVYDLCLEIQTVDDCIIQNCFNISNPLNATQAIDDELLAYPGTDNIINVFANDWWHQEIIINTGQEEAILTIVSEPENGIASITPDPACYGLFCDLVQYVPNDGFVGLDQIGYQLCVNDFCDIAFVYIEVIDEVPIAVIEGDVWPGDANADGTANNFDVLAVGLAFYSEGPERPDASIEWTPQYGPNWETETTAITLSDAFSETGADYVSYIIDNKHADCDGNGVIQAEDIIAIETNYGYSHGKKGFDQYKAAPENPVLSIEIQGDTLLAGSEVTADIVLSMPDGSPVENAYGLAFTIDYENRVEDVPLVVEGTMQLDMIDSWMGNTFNTVRVVKDFEEEQNVDVGFTRIDHQQLSGTGKVGTMSFIIEENVAGKVAAYYPLELKIENAFISNAFGELVPANVISEVIEVATSGTTNPPSFDYELNFYPNPVNDILTVELGDLEVEQITIIDLSGKQVYSNNQITDNILKIETERLPHGMYLMNLLGKDGWMVSRKLEVFH